MDQDTLKGCKKGKRLAQKKLYEFFYGQMMGVCLRYASDRDQAAEIANKGFLKVFKTIKRYDPDLGRLDSWIYKIMVNTAIDHYRAEIRHQSKMVAIDQTYYLSESEDAIEAMAVEEIIELIQKLTPAYRAVFNLYVMEGMSHAEVAEKLDISIGTAKSNLSKARKKLQAWIIQNSAINVKSYAG